MRPATLCQSAGCIGQVGFLAGLQRRLQQELGCRPWIATIGRIRHGCHERCELLWNVPVGFLLAGSTAVQADHRAHLREQGYVSIAFLWIGTDQCLQSVNDPSGVIEPSEIGRASWRESVRTYVENSVVAGSLQSQITSREY